MDDNIHVIQTGGSAGGMAHGEAEFCGRQRSRHPHWRKSWRHGAWRGPVQSRITFTSYRFRTTLLQYVDKLIYCRY